MTFELQLLLKNLNQVMSDIFEVVPHPTRKPHQLSQVHSNSDYIKLQGDFLTHNFGLYALKFIDMICQDALNLSPRFETVSLNKILRDITKKYLLSDLQLVYVGHIASLLSWNFSHIYIRKHCQKMKYKSEYSKGDSQELYFFVSLIAFFVKKYLGQKEESQAIGDLLAKQTENLWNGLYEEWLTTCPSEMFKLSPRAINELYSRYSRHCQETIPTKNYNTMVDRIMELSTTYSMIPGDTKPTKKKRRAKQQEPMQSNSHLFGRKLIKINQLPQRNSDRELQGKNQGFLESGIQSYSSGLGQKEKKYKLGFNKNKESKINHNVTQFFKDNKNPSSISVGKKYNPQSMIGFVDPYPNFFDSKIFSSGEDIIPYPLRSNSNVLKSKLWE